MKTKIVGILVALVVAAFALTAQAQSYPYSSSYGGIQAHSQMLNSQMAVIGARMSLGYVEGGPSKVTPEVQKQRDYVASITKAYEQETRDSQKRICAILMKEHAEFEKNRAKYGWPDEPPPARCQ